MRGQWDNWDDDALAGARDIIAERVSEDAAVRNRVRNIFRRKAFLTAALARGVDKDDERVAKFESWLDWKEPIAKAPSHRILALFRGEEAGVLKVHVRPDKDDDSIRLALSPPAAEILEIMEIDIIRFQKIFMNSPEQILEIRRNLRIISKISKISRSGK